MSKKNKSQPAPAAPQPNRPQGTIPRASKAEHMGSFWSGNLFIWLIVVGALAAGGIWLFTRVAKVPTFKDSNTAYKILGTTNANSPATTNFSVMEVAQALMVTTELDFGPTVPTIAEALKEIERRYEPEDGVGRTFAILDAYGQPTPEGKLHISMHVSTEKPGKATLVFKRTGAVLWQSKIIPLTNKVSRFSGKDLLILVDNGQGKLWTIDGSNNPATVLDANVKEAGIPLRDLWLDQTEREVTFIYSACGCPVKVQTRRDGDRTVRTKELPVIFPDDPAVVSVISKVMAW